MACRIETFLLIVPGSLCSTGFISPGNSLPTPHMGKDKHKAQKSSSSNRPGGDLGHFFYLISGRSTAPAGIQDGTGTAVSSPLWLSPAYTGELTWTFPTPMITPLDSPEDALMSPWARVRAGIWNHRWGPCTAISDRCPLKQTLNTVFTGLRKHTKREFLT